MSTRPVNCDQCDYDMTELYHKGDLFCPKCNDYILTPIDDIKSVDSVLTESFSDDESEPLDKTNDVPTDSKTDWFRVDEDMSVDDIEKRMSKILDGPEKTDESIPNEDRGIPFTIGDIMAYYEKYERREIIGKVIEIDTDENCATIADERTSEEYTAEIKEFYFPERNNLDHATESGAIVSEHLEGEQNIELGISNTTLSNFSNELIKIIKNDSDEITNSLFYSTTVISIQRILSQLFNRATAQEKTRLLTTNISRLWVKNRVYFNGDCLVKINIFENGSEGFIALYAKKTNVGIDPIEHLSDNSNLGSSVWIIIIELAGLLYKIEANDDRPIQTSNIEINRWKERCFNILTCTVCNRTYKGKSEILDKSNIPMPGFCKLSSCNSNIFSSEASKNGQNLDWQIITKSQGQKKLNLLYNYVEQAFYVTTDKLAGEIDVIALWQEFQTTGDMDRLIAKYVPVSHQSNKLEDILDLELKLHRSSADLYAKLRGIPIALNSKTATDLSLTLQELYWLDEQLMRILKNIR